MTFKNTQIEEKITYKRDDDGLLVEVHAFHDRSDNSVIGETTEFTMDAEHEAAIKRLQDADIAGEESRRDDAIAEITRLNEAKSLIDNA